MKNLTKRRYSDRGTFDLSNLVGKNIRSSTNFIALLIEQCLKNVKQ